MKKKSLLTSVMLLIYGSGALATTPNLIVAVPQSIPAISQAGLIALAFIIGIMGARLISKARSNGS